MKLLYSLLLTLFLSCTLFSEEETCALMIGDEIDPEEYSELLGKKIYFCCGSCVKALTPIKHITSKHSPHLLRSFLQQNKKKLGVDKIKLLDQRFCPIYPERVVNPNSKSVEYKGKKIYFWSSSALRRWDRDPEKYFKEAFEKGHLPQFK